MNPLVDASGLAERLREFARERDWDQFHTPKNLAMALAVESGELLELFQWLTPEQSALLAADPADPADPAGRRRVEEEVADVLIYLVRLADVLGLDLDACVRRKLDTNARKYPADRVRGSAEKSKGVVTDVDGADGA